MEVNEIISNLFRDQRVNKCIERFVQPFEADDLKQDVFETLLKKDSGLIIDLHDRGNLFFYTVIVIKNLSLKSKSKKRSTIPLTEVVDDIPEPDTRTDKYINHFNNLDKVMGTFYYRELVNTVVKCGSVYRAAKTVGIPVSSVRRDVIFVREYLKSKA